MECRPFGVDKGVSEIIGKNYGLVKDHLLQLPKNLYDRVTPFQLN